MNVTKCENGHFYDADKYPVCPHCGAKPLSFAAEAENAKPAKKSHRFWGKNAAENIEIAQVPDRTIGKTFGIFGDEHAVDGNENGGVSVPVIQNGDNNLSFTDDIHTDKENDANFSNADKDSISRNYNAECPETDNKTDKRFDQQFPTVETANKSSNLADEIRKVSSDSQDKTVGFFHIAATDKEIAKPAVNDPVVGWLVCIKGAHFGEGFNIYAGRNSVGRSENNRIAITMENTISREKHAWITYEPKKREFFIQPGEGTGLAYLNDENIMESHRLNSKDKIEFGDGIFIFIPLCGKDFSWEDYMGN